MMRLDVEKGWHGYAPDQLPPYVWRWARPLKRHLHEVGIRAWDPAGYTLDQAILLLAAELLMPQMPLMLRDQVPEDQLVLVHYDICKGPDPATSYTRLERALGNTRPGGILSLRIDVPWIFTTFAGAGVAARMNYVTVPVANLKQVVGPPLS